MYVQIWINLLMMVVQVHPIINVQSVLMELNVLIDKVVINILKKSNV